MRGAEQRQRSVDTHWWQRTPSSRLHSLRFWLFAEPWTHTGAQHLRRQMELVASLESRGNKSVNVSSRHLMALEG